MGSRRSFGGAEEIESADLALVDEQPVALTEAVAEAAGEVFSAIAAMLVAGVTIELERRQRTARAHRAPVARKAAA